MTRQVQAALLATYVAIAVGTTEAGLVHSGSEFRVNTSTDLDQGRGAVAAAPDGSFVVVWTDYSGLDGSGLGIFGQRYSSAGGPVGTEFQVNSVTGGSQSFPDIAVGSSGSFVVAFSSTDDLLSAGVFARYFDSSGNPMGSQFQVNLFTPGFQGAAGIATQPDGSFVVVWSGYAAHDSSGFGIAGRRIAAVGGPLGSEFAVNTHTVGGQAFQARGAVSTDGGGNFVVAWQSYLQDGSFDGVFAQRFDSTGAKVGTEFQANQATVGGQRNADIGMAPDGSFVVAWTDYGVIADIVGRRYDSAGNALGGEFVVNSYLFGVQSFPSVAVQPSGRFAVAWDSYMLDGAAQGVGAQEFFADGTPSGGEIQVNTYSTSSQRVPAIGAQANGDFVVVWQSTAQDGSGTGVFGQRLTTTATCRETAMAGCRTAIKGLLFIKDKSPDSKDKLIWKWNKGVQTDLAEFGNPQVSADYALCIYTDNGATRLAELRVSAHALKWSPLGTKGFRYKDQSLSASGVQKIILKGSAGNTARIIVKGKGMNLPDPTLGNLPTPIVVQLVNSGTSVCWESDFGPGTVLDNVGDRLKAKY